MSEVTQKQVRIDDESLGKLQGYLNNYTDIKLTLGDLDLAIESLQNQKSEVINQYRATKKEEQQFISELTSKYGAGSVDIKTGIMTLISEDPTEDPDPEE